VLEGIFNSSEISATVRELLFSENKFKILLNLSKPDI
jgi:hypothetical protein